MGENWYLINKEPGHEECAKCHEDHGELRVDSRVDRAGVGHVVLRG